ncbi:MAG: hypothetical protein OIF54_15560, partial [Cohaesibacter sp.]|nr:hypothetical protein [Cohaesibacter sp.]
RFGAYDFSGTDTANYGAYGYFPSNYHKQGGDIWFNTQASLNFKPGGFGFETALHEIGHTLGLEHPFEGDNILHTSFDNTNNTIMSYTGAGLPKIAPQKLDLDAVTQLYGLLDRLEEAVKTEKITSGVIKIVLQAVDGIGQSVTGSNSDDFILGTKFDDIIAGMAGNDIIVGGAGNDRALYEGSVSNYTITVENGLYQVKANAPDNATFIHANMDYLVDIETLGFKISENQIDYQAIASLAQDISFTDAVYRFYNNSTGTHFYTANAAERNQVISNLAEMKYEGRVFGGKSIATNVENEVEVFRFFNEQTGTHFYTASKEERDLVLRDHSHMTYENVSYYASDIAANQKTALYRFYNTETGSHFYTANANEKDDVAKLANYNYEGIAYYVDIA